MNLFNELSLSTSGLTKGRMVASNKTYAFDLFVEDFSFKVASTTSLSGLSNFVFKIGIVNASNVVTYLTSSISYTNVVADQTITVNLNQTLPAGSRFLWIGNGQNAIKYTSNNGIYGHDIKIYDISLLNVNDTITWAATDTNSLVGFNYTGYIVDNVINPLHNKIINGIGDSLMGNNVEGYENSWLAYIGKRNNMIYNNYGISGNKITGAGGVASRYMNMVDNDDYVVVNGLTNDASASVAFGAVTSTDINEVNGALNILITGLLAKYPTAKILFVDWVSTAETPAT